MPCLNSTGDLLSRFLGWGTPLVLLGLFWVGFLFLGLVFASVAVGFVFFGRGKSF
jgi:hypothetical protein